MNMRACRLISPNFCSRVAGIHGRVSTTSLLDNHAVQFCVNEDRESKSSKEVSVSAGLQISHPWPEWVALMEKLMQRGYFDQIGKNPFPENGARNKEANSIRTACLNFARDHYHFISHLSKKDILVIAASGCPSTDRKVVNSGKRLRSHVGIEEGNVCSSCVLRGNCDRAYVKAREEEGGRTVDVMRFLLTYALDPVTGSVENKPCLNERVQESVRSLLKEMVNIQIEDIGPETESSGEIEGRGVSPKSNIPMKQGDWICPKCSFHNFARNYSCLRCDNVDHDRLKRIAEEHGHLPLKKGDWICDKCNLLNFAKNTRCYLCKGKPPKRELVLGEWECVSCNYINFRRNMLCLKCDHPRSVEPKSSLDTRSQTEPRFPRRRQSMYEKDNSMRFVEDPSSGFMNFPVAGGKSDVSLDVKKQELWKKQMAGRNEYKDDSSRHNFPVFLENDDDDDDTADWFEVSKNG